MGAAGWLSGVECSGCWQMGVVSGTAAGWRAVSVV